jgi:hypothetical protein
MPTVRALLGKRIRRLHPALVRVAEQVRVDAASLVLQPFITQPGVGHLRKSIRCRQADDPHVHLP